MKNLSIRAQFRLAIVSRVLARTDRGESRSSAVATVASQVHHQLDGVQRRVSSRSIHRWLRAYGERKVAGLERTTPVPLQTTTLPEQLVAFRFHQDMAELKSKFVVWVERRVTADNIVSIDSVDYEPVIFMRLCLQCVRIALWQGTTAESKRRRVLDRRLAFQHQDKLIDLHPVNLVQNAHAKRTKGSKPTKSASEDVQGTPPRSAADMAYECDFGPVVDLDGGFPGGGDAGAPESDPERREGEQ